MLPIAKGNTYNFIIVVLVALFSVFCAFQLPHLRFDYDFEAFFPNEDNELELYNNYRQTFEHDNEFVLIAAENRAGIFRKDFLQRFDSLGKELATLEMVREVRSPVNLKTVQFGGLVPVRTNLLHIEDTTSYAADSAAAWQSEGLVGSFFPEKGASLSLFIKTEAKLNKKQSDTLAKAITSVLKKYSFDDTHVAGRIFAQEVYLSELQREFVIFLCLAFVIVVLFLWLTFKSLYGIVVPVTIVLVSILWTLGIMHLLGKPIDLMTTMLPTMVFIAGMSDVVHFFSKYFEEVSKGTQRDKIYPLILKEVGGPTFLTLLTTVVGFLSLLFSSIKPIREFGIYTSLGVTIAFILSYTLLPALLHFFTPARLVALHGHNNRTSFLMRKGLVLTFRNQKTIFVITTVILALSVVGIYKIRVNNILLEDLSDKVRIKQDFIFFDSHYSGFRPLEFEIRVDSSRAKIWDHRVMQDIYKVGEFIKQEYDPGFLISPAGLVMTYYRGTVNGDSLKFPNAEDYAPIEKQLRLNHRNRELKQVIEENGTRARISGKIKDLGSLTTSEHNQKLLDYIAGNTDTSLVTFRITGAAHLVDRNNEYMVNNMVQGFVFSVFVIGLLTFFLHRSWRMVIVFIVPNVIPLVVIGGIMGFAGIELKAATSLVFSIAFGIATDDTIHFISRLKIELGYGKTMLYAFKRTYFETGKPILLTTFILVGGFMSLMTSNFQSTFYFGFLICITVVVALLADLFLLPVLLFLVYGKKKKTISRN